MGGGKERPGGVSGGLSSGAWEVKKQKPPEKEQQFGDQCTEQEEVVSNDLRRGFQKREVA